MNPRDTRASPRKKQIERSIREKAYEQARLTRERAEMVARRDQRFVQQGLIRCAGPTESGS